MPIERDERGHIALKLANGEKMLEAAAANPEYPDERLIGVGIPGMPNSVPVLIRAGDFLEFARAVELDDPRQPGLADEQTQALGSVTEQDRRESAIKKRLLEARERVAQLLAENAAIRKQNLALADEAKERSQVALCECADEEVAELRQQLAYLKSENITLGKRCERLVSAETASGRLSVSVSENLRQQLQELVEDGGYGGSLEEVTRRFVEDGLRSARLNQSIHRGMKTV